MDIENQSGIAHFTPPEAKLIGSLLLHEDTEPSRGLQQKVDSRLLDWVFATVPERVARRFSGYSMGDVFLLSYALDQWREDGQERPTITVELTDEELRQIRDITQSEYDKRQALASSIDSFLASPLAKEYIEDTAHSDMFKQETFEGDLEKIALCGAIVATINRHLDDGNQ